MTFRNVEDNTNYSAVELIVRNYFDNVILVDDELMLEKVNYYEKMVEDIITNSDVTGTISENSSEKKEEIPLKDIEGVKNGDIGIEDMLESSIESGTLTQDEAAPSDESKYTHAEIIYSPVDVLKAFIFEGFIVFPYCYNNDVDLGMQKNTLANVMQRSKLMIIDWHLESKMGSLSAEDDGKLAIELIKQFIEKNKGIKGVVIYTEEETPNIVHQLKSKHSDVFDIVDEQDGFFQEKNEQDASLLFGFVMKKILSLKILS